MNITIIGSGNVAEAFAHAISINLNGLYLREIYSRNEKRGREIAGRYGTSYVAAPHMLAPSDIYLIAVSDSAIGEVSASLTIPDTAVAAHVSGGLPLDALADNIKNKAVIYPLQTFSAGRTIDFRAIPLFIEYSGIEAETRVSRFASALSESVYYADSEKRNKIHVAAVFACNFTNHLYHIASEILSEDSLSFDVIKPLITETAAKAVIVSDPVDVQTGPAARGDEVTIQRHLYILDRESKVQYSEIYKLLSNNIWETLKKT